MKKNKGKWLCLTIALASGCLVVLQLCYLISINT